MFFLPSQPLPIEIPTPRRLPVTIEFGRLRPAHDPEKKRESLLFVLLQVQFLKTNRQMPPAPPPNGIWKTAQRWCVNVLEMSF